MKKFLALALCVLMLLTTTGISYANVPDVTTDESSTAVDVAELISSQGDTTNLSPSNLQQIESEQTLIDALGYDSDTIVSASIVNGDIQYNIARSASETGESTLTIDENSTGDITFDISSSSQEDEILLTCDGDILVNGSPVIINREQASNVVTSGSRQYFNSLPANCGTPSTYTDRQPDQLVQMSTVNAWNTYLTATTTLLFTAGMKVTAQIGATLASATYSVSQFGNSNWLSQRVRLYYSNITHNFLINSYTGVDRRVATFYYNKDYSGTITSAIYYCYQYLY